MKVLYTKLILLCCVVLFARMASAQTVTNVTAEQVNKTIHVSYNLDKQADITLFVSTDGGSFYTQLYRVSGDVGKNISAGHKTIVWDVLAEREKLVGDNIVFKVKAQGEVDLTFTLNGVAFKMIYVKGGTFTMGCTSEQGIDCNSDEKPTHSVTLSDFWMGETEVTQALWQAVMGNNPSYFKGDNRPVGQVSWNDCQEFIRKLNSKLSGQLPSYCRFALPTEAQWEYAARGGNKSRGYKYAGGSNLGDVAWYTVNCYEKGDYGPRPVKSKQANELRLYDMSGNVWEWCSDLYGNYNSTSQTNPSGPPSGSDHVLRGGSWSFIAKSCRVASRLNGPPASNDSYGFRLSLVRQ